VAELEGLLANLRAKEFRSGMETQKSGGQLGAVTERNKLLQQQVTTLQQQVTALQQSRDVQDRELARLRTEALELAQRTAAAAVAATGPSAGGSGSGGAASAAAALQAQRDMQAALADQVSQVCLAGRDKRERGGIRRLCGFNSCCMKSPPAVAMPTRQMLRP
jgi:chromosome segregation ATPase